MSFVAALDALIKESSDGRHACPADWPRVELGSVAHILNGYPFKSDGFGSHGNPVIRIRDVSRGFTDTKFDGAIPEGYWIDRGDLVVGMDGDFASALWRSDRALLNQRVCKIEPDEKLLDRKFLHYILPAYLELVNANTPSVTVKHLSSRTLASLPLPLPRIQVQRDIAARIDELFAEIDDGEAALARARSDLAIWRKSLLKAAVTGDLTGDWRAANPPTETGADLLARILAERQKRWAAEARKEHRSQVIETANHTLPPTWAVTRLGDIFDVYVGATPSRKDDRMWAGDIPWVSSGEVGFCRISSTRETIHRDALRDSKRRIHPPGTVMLGMIGEGKTRGQAAILEIWAAHNQNCASIRVSETDVLPEFVYLFLQERYEESRIGSSGGNQPALNKARIEDFIIPLPPVHEQIEMVLRIEAAESAWDGATLDAHVGATLRQSILAAAFSGKLVA